MVVTLGDVGNAILIKHKWTDLKPRDSLRVYDGAGVEGPTLLFMSGSFDHKYTYATR